MGVHHPRVRLPGARRGGRRDRGHQGAGGGGLHHPGQEAQRERPVPQGGGGDLDNARRPRHARGGLRGAEGGGVRRALRVLQGRLRVRRRGVGGRAPARGR